MRVEAGLRALVCLVAVSALAGVWWCSPAAAIPTAPEGRGWEVISPLQKGGADITLDGPARAALAGGRVTYLSAADFAGGGGSSSKLNQILSTRTATGWMSLGINPPYIPGIPSTTNFTPGFRFPPDLSRGIAEVYQTDPVLGGDRKNVFLYSIGEGSWTPLSRPSAQLSPSASAGGNTFVGASEGYSHVVFLGVRALTPDAPVAPDDLGRFYLYDWSDGQLRLASVLPGGAGPVVNSEVALGQDDGTASYYAGDHAVSSDGSRIFFTTVADGRLYVRIDDQGDPAPAATLSVDASERTDCAEGTPCTGDPAPDPGGRKGSSFQLASADGTVAFFTSLERLTDDATAGGANGRDLYRWDSAAPAGQRLTDLTTADPDGGGAGGSGAGPDGNDLRGGVIGASQDGERVYFVATGKLVPEAAAGGQNLYLWQEGHGVRFIAQLRCADPFGDCADLSAWSIGTGSRQAGARVSGDGKRLLVRSRAELTSYDTAGHAQIYLYDADNDVLTCVSCNTGSATSTGDAWLRRNELIIPYDWVSRNLSADANRVYFDSSEALVPQDTNGRIDVYEWTDGHVRLLSGGQSTDDSAFIDASASGDDVFFVTRGQLACQDTDNLVDLYDARIGGGFGGCDNPPSCKGDSCQGQPPTPPPFVAPASSAFRGPGNVKVRPHPKPKRCKQVHVKKKVKGKHRCLKKRKKTAKRVRHTSGGQSR